ncbi:MAG: Asp-tRNA(Asn)/Glu-tRNA(Gln) amidotransferase subunit GatA [Myxococcota bacterium]
MTALHERTLAELVRLVGSGEVDCRTVVEAFLVRMQGVDERVGALLTRRPEEALHEAEEADAARARGAGRGPLHGLPLVVKANLVSPKLEASCASRMLEGFRAPYESDVLTRVREAGMIVLGTTNMDEFAMGSSCENSGLGRTANPWDLRCVPGGSSGGSAAAVAVREAPAALGSDTGGSIRQPAALCGVVGLKPTYGRVSRYGLVAFASSLDQIGPLAQTVEDTAWLLGVIAGHDPRDSTCVDAPVPDYRAALGQPIEGLRVGVPRALLDDEALDPEVRAAVEASLQTLEDEGARSRPIDLPHGPFGVAAYYLIATAEASSNLARYDGVKYGFRANGGTLDEMYRRTRSQGFGAEVKRRILLGTFVLSAGYYDAYYRKAQQVRTLIRRDFEQAFERCDVILLPTTPSSAWPLGELVDDPLAMYLSDRFTVGVNLAGLPAVSLPCGFTKAGLPIGLQLVGRALDEPTLIRVGDAYQRCTDWHRALPPLDAVGA